MGSEAFDLWCKWAAGEKHDILGRREAPELLLGPGGQPVALYNSAQPCNCSWVDHDPKCLWGDECKSFTMAAAFLLDREAGS